MGEISRRVLIGYSTRLRTSLGRCYPDQGVVRIHIALSEPTHSSLLKLVLCHEVAHVAAYDLFGSRIKPHGPEWQSLAQKAGITLRATIPTSISIGDMKLTTARKYLYEHTCTVCQQGFSALRTDRRWRCRQCSESGIEATYQVTRRSLDR